MKIKKLCAVALLLLLSFYAKAQNWQAYKGIWLNGYDNATQAPIPPTGYSALTYFADSLGTYVYDWDSLAWLRIPGAGGGGGGGANASNGLSIDGVSGNVILGGSALDQTTTIEGAGQELYFGPETNRLSRFETHSQNAFVSTVVQGVEVGQIEMLLGQLTLFQDNSSSSTTWRSQPSNIYAEYRIDANNVTSQDISGSGIVSIYRSSGVSTTLNLMDEQVQLTSSAGSGLEFDVSSTSESVIQSTPSGDNLRFTTNNGNLVFDDPVFLPQSPTVLDTAVWFLARRNSDGAIVRRQAAGGGGGFTTADNGLIANTASNVRIGTSAQPGEVLDEGAVFATDSLNVGVSHFWFMPDSVQIGNLTDLGEGDEPAYVLIKDGTVSAHTSNTEVRLQKGGITTMQVLFGGVPQYSFGSSLFRYGSSGLTPATRLFEIANGSLLQFTSRIGDFMAFQTQDGATGTESTGDILIRTGSVTSGTGAVGDIEITLGTQAGSGSGGHLQLDPASGFLTIINIPTSDPCGSAPSGTVWNNSGVLSICP